MNKNKANSLLTNIHAKNQANPRMGILFIVLIVVQFYLAPLIGLAAGKDLNNYRDYLYLYIITSYTLIILAIIIFHPNLDVLQDHYSLWIITIGCFIAAAPEKTFMVYRVFLVLLGLRLSVHIMMNRKGLKIPSFKSVFVGLLWAASTIFLIVLLLAFLNPARTSLPVKLSSYILNTSLYEISFVTVVEEAAFRGLLFGLLLMNGYEEKKALFTQALLFWGMHYLKMPNTSLFFVAIPLLTLSATLIIKKYKMLYLSVLVHTSVNVFVSILVVVLQQSVV